MQRAITNEGRRRTLDEIMGALDEWVSRHGNGQYEQGDRMPMEGLMIPDDAGIQQDRREIEAFVSTLLSRDRLGSVLEVGLGYFGSTHFLWRLLFDHVTTIEKSPERIRTFGTNLRNFSGHWVLDDHRSGFVIGMSDDPPTVRKAYQHLAGGIDLLFVDGDHQYASVLTDWLLYSPLVRAAGLVAFHDVGLTLPGHSEVPAFLEDLSRGAVDGRPRTLQTIRHTPYLGIAFYEQHQVDVDETEGGRDGIS
ncbi:MAG: hypothetical protein A3G88_05460 [Omnitrophica WOR_2 bacterium RIFCSPLOWO2_12_FULL_63_16]|nr:MAG: hypothetical protein A3G88_05460 [Omnitrophica WOR_2 bacterium RIFCSPLOWO2_12_FULL_63_16]